MNVDDLTIGQVKSLMSLVGGLDKPDGLSGMIGEKVIIRTYSAGVWFGVFAEKSGNEVIINDARRMYQWWAAESISLSGVALHGIKQEKSKICEPLPSVWLEAIEIIPCAEAAIKSLEGAPNVSAQ